MQNNIAELLNILFPQIYHQNGTQIVKHISLLMARVSLWPGLEHCRGFWKPEPIGIDIEPRTTRSGLIRTEKRMALRMFGFQDFDDVPIQVFIKN